MSFRNSAGSASDATQVLKDILCIGRSNSAESPRGSDVSTVSLPTPLQHSLDAMQAISSDRSKMSSQYNSCDTGTLSGSSSFLGDYGGNENLLQAKQRIILEGDDRVGSYAVHSTDVDIVSSKTSGSSVTPASTRVISDTILRHSWQHKQYFGNQIAVHNDGAYMACCITTGKLDASKVVVRVVNYKTLHHATLRGFDSSVVDIEFAHVTSNVILGAAECTGCIHVYNLSSGQDNHINVHLLVKITSYHADLSHTHHRLRWCRYIPPDVKDEEKEEEDNPGMLLALVTDNVVDVFNVESMIKQQQQQSDGEYGSSMLIISGDHSSHINDVVFSPEGSPLATVCSDGFVKFYSVDLSNPDSTKCVQTWIPHGGRPVTSLFFLDDHKHITPETQFWKFALTGSDDNCEFKLWSCETWSCLQTVSISPASNVQIGIQVPPCIRAVLDDTASFLVLTDIKRKVLYVFNLCYTDDALAYISTVSDYLLSSACLSFALLDLAAVVKPQCQLGARQGSLDNSRFIVANDVFTPAEESIVQLRLFAIKTSGLELTTLQVQTDGQALDRFTSNVPDIDIGAFRDSCSSEVITMSGDFSLPRRTSSNGEPKNAGTLLSVTTQEKRRSPIDAIFTHGIIHNNVPVLSQSAPDVTAELHGLSHPTESVQNASKKTERDTQSAGHSSSHACINSQVFSGNEDPAMSPARHTDFLSDSFLTSSPAAGVKGVLKKEFPSSREDLENVDKNRVETKYREKEDGGERRITEAKRIAEAKASGRSTQRNSADRLLSSDGEIGRGGRRVEVTDPMNKLSKPSTMLFSTDTTVDIDQRDLEVIMNMLREQSESIKELRVELAARAECPASDCPAQLDIVQTSLESKISTIAELEHTQFKRLLDGMQKIEASNREELVKSLSQSIERSVSGQLQTVVRDEIKTSVIPALTKSLEPVTKKILTEYSTKLSATDSLLKDGIAKMIKSKQMTDAISQAAASVMETSLHSTCRDVIVTSFDRACQEIFRQVERSFKSGLQQYIQIHQEMMLKDGGGAGGGRDPLVNQVHDMVDSLKRAEDSRQPIYKELTSLTTTMKAETAHAGKQRKHLDLVIDQAIQRLSVALRESLRQIVHEEVSREMHEHQSAISDQIMTTFNSSRAVTPAPSAHNTIEQQQRGQITALLRQGQFNMAFQQALLATDLKMVIFACESTTPSQLFGQHPCPLQQPILLSLIQQLSVDLTTNTQLKHKYLEEALLNLDGSNPSVKEHFPVALGQLCAGLESYLHSPNIDPHMKRPMKMLLMAAKSLLGGRW